MSRIIFNVAIAITFLLMTHHYNFVSAKNTVVVVPLFGDEADPSHDHDDRYFGFGHTLRSAIVEAGATISSTSVRFPATGSPRMTISFGLPPGRIEGRPILVQIPFIGPPSCAFVLNASGVAGPFLPSTRFLNGSWSVVGSPNGIVLLGPAPQGDNQSTAVVTMRYDQASQLGAGAFVEMRLVRLADNAADTCSGTVSARGGFSVEY